MGKRIFIRPFSSLRYIPCHARSPVKQLAELFWANVLKMHMKEGLIDEAFVQMIMKWRHISGFSVDNSVRIKKGDCKGLTVLAQYIIRSPFSLSKLRYHKDSGKSNNLLYEPFDDDWHGYEV